MRKIILFGTLLFTLACNSNENNTGQSTTDSIHSTPAESSGNSPGSMNTDTSHMDTMHIGGSSIKGKNGSDTNRRHK